MIARSLLLLTLFFFLDARGQTQDQEKKDPMSFPLEIKSSQKIKPKIMSLVVAVKGDGNRFLSDEESFSLVPGRLIPSKGLFMVPLESSVTFRPMPGITAMLMEDTRLQMKGLEVVKRYDKISQRKALLFLNEGSIFTSIQKLNNKTTTYQVQTPQAIVSAKGTKFWVTFKNGKGKVGVVNGVVEVKTTNGDKFLLKQDQYMEMEGIGKGLKVGEIRFPNVEEQQLTDNVVKSISSVEGVTAASVNPFLTTSEATGNSFYDQQITSPFETTATDPNAVDSTAANPDNTSVTSPVSPVGP